MTISDKTRKLLWGRSGNRCAYCRRELVMLGTTDDDSVIGDECHIIAKHENGPRNNPSLSEKEIDSYENLILLCKIHHKMVDDQPIEYSINVLRKMKLRHEEWVRNTLQSASKAASPPKKIAAQITKGKEVLAIVSGAHFFDFDYDEPKNPEEKDLIGYFLQTLQDWGDIGDELEQSARVDVGFELTKDIDEINNAGFLVFGVREIRKLKVGDTINNWSVAVIRIYRKTNPSLVKIDLQNKSSP
jgi:hypothetical protein